MVLRELLPVNTADLIRHDPFLRRLARSLLGDAARADDVVQQAFVAALQRRGAACDTRSWLAGAVRNLSFRSLRDDSRRTRREQARARDEIVRSTADVVAAEELRRQVADAVLALAEPYRTVLLLRYYDDLAPREIARRLDVPGSTVRTRLKRALEQLGTVLDARCDGDRRAWCLPLVAFVAAGAAGTKVTALLAAAAVAALAVGGLFWARADRAEHPLRRDARHAPLRRAEPVPRPVVGQSVAESIGEPSAVQSAPSRFSTPSALPEGTRVALVELVRGVPAERAAATSTVRNATLDLSVPHNGRYLVVALDAQYRPASAAVSLKAGAPLRWPKPVFEAGVSITGRVVMPGTRALQGVHVRARLLDPVGRRIRAGSDELLWTPRGLQKLETSARTDADGRFSLAGLEARRYLVWIEDIDGTHPDVCGTEHGWRYACDIVAPAAAPTFTVPLSMIELVVHDGVEPVPHARVWTGGLRTDVDQTGHRRLLVRPGVEYAFDVAKEGYETRTMTIAAPDDGKEREVAVELLKKGGLATLVVTLRPQGPNPRSPLPKTFGFQLGESGRRTVAVEDGRCTIEELVPGTYPLTSRAGGWWLTRGGYYLSSSREVVLTPGTTTRIELLLKPAGRVRLHVSTVDGRTDVSPLVEIAAVGRDPLPLTFLRGGAGGYLSTSNRLPDAPGPVFVAEPLLPGRYRVTLDTVQSVEFTVTSGRTVDVRVEIQAGRGR